MCCAGKLMVVVREWGSKSFGPLYFHPNLNPEMYLNMFARHDQAVPAKQGWRISGVFPAKMGTISLWYLRAAMVRSAVPGFVAVIPRSDFRGPQNIAHSIFTCGDTFKTMVYQGKNTKHESPKGIHSRCNFAYKTRVRHEWESRISICFQSNGNYIEHILLKSVNIPYVWRFMDHLVV
jgi:hypothetical protein